MNIEKNRKRGEPPDQPRCHRSDRPSGANADRRSTPTRDTRGSPAREGRPATMQDDTYTLCTASPSNTDDDDEKAPSKQRDATPGRSTRPPVRRREGGRAGLLARSALRQDGEGRTARNDHTHAMPIRAHKTQLHHRQRPKVVANRQVFALGIPHTYDCRTFGGIHQNDIRRPDP